MYSFKNLFAIIIVPINLGDIHVNTVQVSGPVTLLSFGRSYGSEASLVDIMMRPLKPSWRKVSAQVEAAPP